MSEALEHLPRSPAFWQQVRDSATSLGAFLKDHARNQYREVLVHGMLAGHHAQLAVFDRSSDGGVECSVSVEVAEDEWVRVLSCAPLTTLDDLVAAAQEGVA